MATLMPPKKERRDTEGLTVGLMHPTGGKAVARLAEAGVAASRGLGGAPGPRPAGPAGADAGGGGGVRRRRVVRAGRHRPVPGRDDGPLARRGLPSLRWRPAATARRRTRSREGLGRWVTAHPELVPGSGGAPAGRRPRVVSIAVPRPGRHGQRDRAGRPRPVPPRHGGAAAAAGARRSPSTTSAPQALVQNAVAAVGSAGTRRRRWSWTTREWIGSPFLAMPRVAGDIPGPAPFFDPYVRDAGPGPPAASCTTS